MKSILTLEQRLDLTRASLALALRNDAWVMLLERWLITKARAQKPSCSYPP